MQYISMARIKIILVKGSLNLPNTTSSHSLSLISWSPTLLTVDVEANHNTLIAGTRKRRNNIRCQTRLNKKKNICCALGACVKVFFPSIEMFLSSIPQQQEHIYPDICWLDVQLNQTLPKPTWQTVGLFLSHLIFTFSNLAYMQSFYQKPSKIGWGQ